MKHIYMIQTIQPNYTFRQRGASLLEGIAYLGIAAIVILGAVSLLTGAFSSAQTNRGAEEIVAVRTAVKKLFMGQAAGYGNVSLNKNLILSGGVPKTLQQDKTTGTITNAWNGAVVVTGATSQFTLEYDAVPDDVCVNIVSSSAGWDQIQVNGTVTAATPAGATAQCTAGANKIIWTAS